MASFSLDFPSLPLLALLICVLLEHLKLGLGNMMLKWFCVFVIIYNVAGLFGFWCCYRGSEKVERVCQKLSLQSRTCRMSICLWWRLCYIIDLFIWDFGEWMLTTDLELICYDCITEMSTYIPYLSFLSGLDKILICCLIKFGRKACWKPSWGGSVLWP